jgi:hypothetical protein
MTKRFKEINTGINDKGWIRIGYNPLIIRPIIIKKDILIPTDKTNFFRGFILFEGNIKNIKNPGTNVKNRKISFLKRYI